MNIEELHASYFVCGHGVEKGVTITASGLVAELGVIETLVKHC
jgi:hypothetical protein